MGTGSLFQIIIFQVNTTACTCVKFLTNPERFKCLFMRELEKYPARCLSCKLLYAAKGLKINKKKCVINIYNICMSSFSAFTVLNK